MPPKQSTAAAPAKTQAKKVTTTAAGAPKPAAAAKKASPAKAAGTKTTPVKASQPAVVAETKPALAVPEAPKVHRVALKLFASAVLRDGENLWKSSGKWPLIIDESEKVQVFMQFQNALLLDVGLQEEMASGVIRLRVLNAIRYGHPLVLNLHGLPDVEFVKQRFEEAQPNLWSDLFSKKILQEETYMKLVRPGDGEEYEPYKFGLVKDFVFMPIVAYNSGSKPPSFLLETCVAFHVFNPKPQEAIPEDE